MESLQDLRKYSYCAVNLVLAAVQILVFILCTATGNKMYIAGRCGTDLVLAQGQYWRLLTSVFLHAGLSHLGSNLLVQILMGNAVERNLGHIRYLALYLLSGIGGNVISVLYDRAQGVNIYSVGASGAVFGVMGTLFVLIIRGRKKLRSGSSLLTRAAFAVFYAVLTAGLEDVDLRDLR